MSKKKNAWLSHSPNAERGSSTKPMKTETHLRRQRKAAGKKASKEPSTSDMGTRSYPNPKVR